MSAVTLLAEPARSVGPTRSEQPHPPVKVLIVGRHGAGKTTLVRSLSQVPPLCTDVTLTDTPDCGGGDTPVATAALDFGRTSVDDTAVYLFAAPGHPRFAAMLDSLAAGARGAVVLVDVASPADALPVLDEVRTRCLPYLVAVNRFPPAAVPSVAEVRNALQVPALVPVIACDARQPSSAQTVLRRLVRGMLTGRLPSPTEARPTPERSPRPVPPTPSFWSSALLGDGYTPLYGGI